MYKKRKNAYMTVEASLIMPIILGGIVFTIYLGIYLYNVCAIRQAAYIAALRGSQLRNASSSEIEVYVEQELEKLLSGQILAKNKIGKEIKVSLHKIKVEINTDMKALFTGFISSKTGFWTVEIEAEANRVNPVDIIRNVRKLNESQISK